MKKLLILLGLADEQPPKTEREIRFISTYPKNQPPLHDWCKEFRFGMMYDRRAIYMN